MRSCRQEEGSVGSAGEAVGTKGYPGAAPLGMTAASAESYMHEICERECRTHHRTQVMFHTESIP